MELNPPIGIRELFTKSNYIWLKYQYLISVNVKTELAQIFEQNSSFEIVL